MSVKKRRAKARLDKDFRKVESLIGLWSSLDPEEGVLVCARRAVTGEYYLKDGTPVITLFCDLVKFQKVKGLNWVESFPNKLKQILPNRSNYLTDIKATFGRNKKGVIKNVALRGRRVVGEKVDIL